MKLLIIGRTGQLARSLDTVAASLGISAYTVGRDDIDLANSMLVTDAARDLCKKTGCDAIINAAAYTAVDKAEDEADLAQRVNGDAPRALAEACLSANIPLVHISTDYVFAGTKTSAYVEDDATGPKSMYGLTKLSGEAAVRTVLPRQHLVIRTAWVYSAAGQNFMRTMLRLGSERDVLRVVDDQTGCPTAARDLASAAIEMTHRICSETDKSTVSGTYHFAGSGSVTWCGFARAIFDRARILRPGTSWAHVEAIATSDYPTKALRPANSVLECGKVQRIFGIAPRRWDVALDDVMNEWAGMEVNS